MSVWATTMPQAMEGLLEAFATVPLDGELRDGPAVGDESAKEVITVGYLAPDDDTAVEAESERGGLAGDTDRERYQVHCAIAVLTGDEIPQKVRQRAADILQGCGQRLNDDPKLGGAVMRASISSWSLREDMTTGGAYVKLRFDVSIDAFTRRR